MERTVSDLLLEDDGVEEMVVESNGQVDTAQPAENLFTQAFRQAGIHLKAIRRLNDDASKRAALPTSALRLEDRSVWTNLRVRSLAVACDLAPPPGTRRKPFLKLIESFRREPETLDLNEEPL